MSLTDADAHSNLAALLSEPPLITSSSASTFDNLTCLWAHCGERAASPEHLYVRSNHCNFLTIRTMPPSLLMLSHAFRADFDRAIGTRVRAPCWAQKHKQSQFAMPVGQLSYHHCQTGSHHFAHPGSRPTQAAQMRIVWKVIQETAGLEEARQDSCGRLSSPEVAGIDGIE